MNYVESFYTGIAGNNYNLKVIKNKILYNTKSIIGKQEHQKSVLGFLIVETNQLTLQNIRFVLPKFLCSGS
jgi:hypothetical protein